jgi:hypothetical protein
MNVSMIKTSRLVRRKTDILRDQQSHDHTSLADIWEKKDGLGLLH